MQKTGTVCNRLHPLQLLLLISFVSIFAGCNGSGDAGSPDGDIFDDDAIAEAGFGLDRDDFSAVSEPGLGDHLNTYAWSMGWFNDKLYVGTGRDYMCLAKMIRKLMGRDTDSPIYDAIDCAKNPMEDTSVYAAEIWRYTPSTGLWERVYVAPMITLKLLGMEFSLPRDYGYRGMTVWRDGIGRDVLVVGTYSLPGRANLLVSYDGENFQETNPRVPSNPRLFRSISSYRSIQSFRGKLYMAPSSSGGGGNVSNVVQVFESDDPISGEWRPVCEPKFGERSNMTIFELGVHEGELYAGTGSSKRGFQIWKTDGLGDSVPYNWSLVIDKGAGRGRRNEGAVSMHSFGGYLYVGTGIQHGGYDYENKVGPAGAEILRIKADGTWDLVVGDSRRVDGEKVEPISGMDPGFGRMFTGYMWRMCDYDGWLYMGTFDNTIFLSSMKHVIPKWWHDEVDAQVAEYGGFDLWRTKNGAEWVEIDHNGFGKNDNYGMRTCASTPVGLFLGTANIFIKRDPVTEEPIAGGCEVFLGK